MKPQRWVRDNFLAGLAVVLPVVLSIFLFVWIVETITGRVSDIITESWFGIDKTPKDGESSDTVQTKTTDTDGTPRDSSKLRRVDKFFLRVVILVAMIVATISIGWVARNMLGRHLIRFGDMILEKIPLFNRIYIVLRQISQSVLSEKSEMFSAVVLVEFPRPGLRSLAFITGRSKGEIQDKTQGDVYTLFVPTSPNPTSGYMIMATEDEFDRLDMSVEEGMKMVISGGAVLPEPRKLLEHYKRSKTEAPPLAPTTEGKQQA
ncbi:MAG: DUF502 domain-containing protein [Verrucomicrobia bacterium]|nr:DUF502 domain-containing protein [Verrucomicrobiota bacterium]